MPPLGPQWCTHWPRTCWPDWLSSLTARAIRVNPDNFLAAYFGSVALRLVAGMGAVMAYLYTGGAHAGRATYTFLGAFFILYFLFAGFEIWAILTNLRPFSKKQVPEQ